MSMYYVFMPVDVREVQGIFLLLYFIAVLIENHSFLCGITKH